MQLAAFIFIAALHLLTSVQPSFAQNIDGGARPPLSKEEISKLPCVVNRTCLLANYVDEATIVWKADPGPISLLGSGVSADPTRESLAVACVDSEKTCSTLQFVNLVNVNEVYLIGPRFSVTPEVVKGKTLTPKETLSRIVDRVRKDPNHNARGMIVMGLVTAASVTAVVATHILSYGLLPMLIGAIVVSQNNGDPGMLDFITPMEKKLNRAGNGAISYQDGWNWNLKPVHIKNDQYERVMMQLLFQAYQNSYDEVGHQRHEPLLFSENQNTLKKLPIISSEAFKEFEYEYLDWQKNAPVPFAPYFGNYEVVNCYNQEPVKTGTVFVSLTPGKSLDEATLIERTSDGSTVETKVSVYLKAEKIFANYRLGFYDHLVAWRAFGPEGMTALAFEKTADVIKFGKIVNASRDTLYWSAQEVPVNQCLHKVEVAQ